MYYYAQINSENICICVSQLSGPVDLPNMIPIESEDSSLCGKMWTGSEWIDPPEPEPEKKEEKEESPEKQ
jgi:hypothetical protein